MEANQLAVEYLGHTFKVTAISMTEVVIAPANDDSLIVVNGVDYVMRAVGLWMHNRWILNTVYLRRDPFTSVPPTEAAKLETWRIARSILEQHVDGNHELLEAGNVVDMNNQIERLEREIAEREEEIASKRRAIASVKKVLAP